MTAYATQDERQRSFACGMSDHVSKQSIPICCSK
jgi:CheY-like chemotaxis protein